MIPYGYCRHNPGGNVCRCRGACHYFYTEKIREKLESKKNYKDNITYISQPILKT